MRTSSADGVHDLLLVLSGNVGRVEMEPRVFLSGMNDNKHLCHLLRILEENLNRCGAKVASAVNALLS